MVHGCRLKSMRFKPNGEVSTAPTPISPTRRTIKDRTVGPSSFPSQCSAHVAHVGPQHRPDHVEHVEYVSECLQRKCYHQRREHRREDQDTIRRLRQRPKVEFHGPAVRPSASGSSESAAIALKRRSRVFRLLPMWYSTKYLRNNRR